MIDSREVSKTPSIAANLDIGRRMMDAVNSKNLSLLDELLAPDYQNKQLEVYSLEDLKEVLRKQYAGFPDIHRTIDDIIADEDSVWIKVRITATHTDEYRGIEPTGAKIVMEAVPHYRIVDGKIVEGWSVWNPIPYLKPLGVIEYKGFPDEIHRPL
ncbi:MAG: ester cyclase [Promethearchaeota archaeon]